MKLFKSVYSKMLFGYLLLTAGLLLALGIAVSVAFRSIYLGEIQNGLMREADDINSIAVTKYIDAAKRPVARDELLVIARRYDAYIQLYFVDELLGKCSFSDADTGDRWNNAELADLSLNVALVEDGNYDRVTYNLLSDYTLFDTMTIARQLVDEDGNVVGALFFHYDMTSVNESISTVFMSVTVILLAGLLISIPLSMLLARRMTRPISHMTEVVNCYTKGDFVRRVSVRGNDELAQLGRSFNTMSNELNSLEAARRSFVANVSHELRSPLTSMRGFLEAMEDGTIPPEDRDAYIAVVLDENRRMTVMVNDLLDLARIESGQYKLNITVFDINELIRRVIITFEARVAAKNLGVDVNLSDGRLFVEADPDRISQVLHNLVDNAVKYTSEGGKIGIECRADRHIVRVSVTNNGSVISRDDLPHVFDRFYKAEKAHTPDRVSGTGLGLSIAKLIIDQHGQNITASSGKNGTEFAFTLKRGTRPAGKEQQNAERTKQGQLNA